MKATFPPNFVWNNYTAGKWELKETFCQNSLMHLFNGDRPIVHWSHLSKILPKLWFKTENCVFLPTWQCYHQYGGNFRQSSRQNLLFASRQPWKSNFFHQLETFSRHEEIFRHGICKKCEIGINMLYVGVVIWMLLQNSYLLLTLVCSLQCETVTPIWGIVQMCTAHPLYIGIGCIW